MEKILVGLVVVAAGVWVIFLLVLEIYARIRGWSVEEVILDWAAPRLRKRFTRVVAQPPAHVNCRCHSIPVVENDMPDYPLPTRFKLEWLELICRNIERENKSRWN